MSERTYEVHARYISAAYLTDTDEIAVLAPEVPLPEDHNCDAMGCGSTSHVAFRAPRDVMNQLDECEDKLREAEAERDARVPFEEHAAEVKRVFREGMLMAFSGTAESVIDMRWHESNAQRRLTERREGA